MDTKGGVNRITEEPKDLDEVKELYANPEFDDRDYFFCCNTCLAAFEGK